MRRTSKLLLFVFMFIIFSSLASAVNLNDSNVYFSFDNSDTIGAVSVNLGDYVANGTVNGVTTGITGNGILKQAYGFDGTKDNVTISQYTADLLGTDASICMWMNATSGAIIGKADDTSNYLVFYASTNKLRFEARGAPYGTTTQISVNDFYNIGWVHVCIIKDSANMMLYRNGTNVENLTVSASYTELTDDLSIGQLAGIIDLTGEIDEVGIYNNTVLTDVQISFLFNNGDRQNPYTVSSLPQPFSKVKLINGWNGSNIVGVNVTLSNGVSNLTQGDGIATFNNISGNLSFNASLISYLNLSSVTSENNTLTFNMSQTIINVSVNRSFINDKVCNFSLNNSISGIVLNTSGCSGLIYPNVGSYNFTVIDNTGVEAFSIDNGSLLVKALDNVSATFTVFGHLINIRAKNILDGSAINFFNVTVTALNFTNIRTFNTSSGLISIPAVDGSFNVSIDAENFSLFNNSKVINVNNAQVNFSHNFSLFTTNSVNITFRDIDNNSVLSGVNVTIQFIGLTSQTNITNTGSLFIDLFTPDEYTLISNANTYRQNSYITNIVSRGYTNITIYLTKTNNTQLVLIKVRDEFNSPIRNAIVTIQRYINNIWKTDQILKTDFNGQTEGYYIVSTQFYNHLVNVGGSTVFGVINSNANKKVIYAEDVSNGIVITANVLEDSSLPQFQATEGDISISLNYTKLTNSTGFFTYRAIDNNGLQHTFKLKVTKGGELVSVCDNSSFEVSDTSSAIITCNVNETGFRTVYVASGFIDGFNKITVTEVVGEHSGRQIDWGVNGYILAFFILVVIYFSYLASPTLSLWLGTIFFVGFAITGVIFGDMSYGVLMILVAMTYLVANINSKSGVNA